MANNINEFIDALHTIQNFCLSINCEDCPLFVENGLSVCEFKPYLWGTIPDPVEYKKKEGVDAQPQVNVDDSPIGGFHDD